jgi:hypothetical protein
MFYVFYYMCILLYILGMCIWVDWALCEESGSVNGCIWGWSSGHTRHAEEYLKFNLERLTWHSFINQQLIQQVIKNKKIMCKGNQQSEQSALVGVHCKNNNCINHAHHSIVYKLRETG